ncbi:hypothetical protein SAY86_017580 [Trapa natans]|uniref:Lipoxygenase n=1 Tax=Trapa natans TaxID=22666 RepID=A0AAN7R7J2_TRANT|nr:hypothetical protein SAY86_017580 [Trapa natans]
MALCKEIMGLSVTERESLTLPSMRRQQRGLLTLVPLKRRARVFRAAISEDLMKAVSPTPLGKGAAEPAASSANLKVRVVVTVRQKNKEDLKETLVKYWDALTDKIGLNVVLQLVSTELDPKTKAPKKSKEAALDDWSQKLNAKTERVQYIAELTVNSNFGIPGAVLILNKHQKEFFLEAMVVEGFPGGAVNFPCNSWVQSKKDHRAKRIFFSNKAYLPTETPVGLRALREQELKNLRGDGTGVRKLSDRIYDYDVYNDLGNPDRGIDFVRPTLGGSEIPYPRRCRTGREPSETDINAECRVEKPTPLYVPRDEQFEESKMDTFSTGRLKAVLHNLLPNLKASLSAKNKDFNCFTDIDNLFKEGLLLKVGLQDELLKKLPLPRVVQESSHGLLKFTIPKIISKDKFAWLRDDEFARQAIAGINPVSIERLTVFPPQSKLDPEIYGPLDSALKEEHILGYLDGMSVQQAIDENKLFVLDHHDAYFPFINKINALDGHKTYATRTIFYLTQQNTLKPIAIELTSPPGAPSSRSKRVVTPPVDSTTNWIWQLAKAHVSSNDAGVHQLVNHWLKTHAAMEPFILAAHRQMSTMHPIYKLLDPHMRYTLEINAIARQNLINADGVIENCFTPGRYAMEISAAAYKSFWRFDQEGLPRDLIRRGMAVPDDSQPHGLRLVLEDYPYAADGLLLWSAIEKWVQTYVDYYYKDADMVCNDRELQAWYSESVNVGHADLRHADWWPKLESPDDLASILTQIIWLSSAQHAALNFAQYPYGGFIPNRPPMMRRLIPEEGDPEYINFLADPQRYFLSALSSLLQATKYMAVVDNLSTHSPDEEYLGERQQPSVWSADPEMVKAFYEFSSEVKRIEKEIERRNNDPNLKNRCGAGVLPYELLAPSSEAGVTCRGVPNSISI